MNEVRKRHTIRIADTSIKKKADPLGAGQAETLLRVTGNVQLATVDSMQKTASHRHKASG